MSISADKFKFYNHHLTHAASAYYMSGFENSLVVTLDGAGDGLSGSIMLGSDSELKLIETIPNSNSLGEFYTRIISFIGYSRFDEYKVMGMAPYGDPEKFRYAFREMYELTDNGNYQLNMGKIHTLYDYLLPRKPGQPFQQIHKDLAAALQEVLEIISLHFIGYHQQKTQSQYLSLAGGVVQNSKMNGLLFSSKMFEKIFVQPAAYDAGCALGAAQLTYYEYNEYKPDTSMSDVYWGLPVVNNTTRKKLENWSKFISYQTIKIRDVADLLAKGAVIGWVQGRSEFGARALGSRSIIADPRPVENKNRINGMIKKREAYRPFAPSVLKEKADEYFILPNNQRDFPFMTFVMPVQKKWQKQLGAITHVDGTARLQTVDKITNQNYWELINEFGQLTGIYLLLNTSFNNNAEPIVDSIEDAITCYLTTDLDYLVIGEYLIIRNDNFKNNLVDCFVCLPVAAELYEKLFYSSLSDTVAKCYISWNYCDKDIEISSEMYSILRDAQKNKIIIGDLFYKYNTLSKDKLLNELFDLWSERWVIIEPQNGFRHRNI